jgi:hypothetical protein
MEKTYHGAFEPNGSGLPTNVTGGCAVTRTDEGRFKIVIPTAFPRLVTFHADLMTSTADDGCLAYARFTDGMGSDGKTFYVQVYKRDEDVCAGVDLTSNQSGSVLVAYSITVDDTPLLANNADASNGSDYTIVGGPDGGFIV